MSTPVAIGSSSVPERLRALERLIGNTPLLAIEYEVRGRQRTIYAKSEQMNFTGSIKDRMALHILRNAYAADAIRPGDTIVEATSGNTGIAFAAIGRALGHPVTIFMPNWMKMTSPIAVEQLSRGFANGAGKPGEFRYFMQSRFFDSNRAKDAIGRPFIDASYLYPLHSDL
jgi:threonine dehydratase